MSGYLLRQCLIITFTCFSIYPKKVSSIELQVIKNIQQLKFGKVKFLTIEPKFKKLTLNEEQMQKFKIWPRGVIPYYIDDFSFDKALRDRIRLFLEQTSAQTLLQFVELPHPPENAESEDNRWVFFINRRGQLECVDYSTANFTNKGMQKVVVGYDCLGVSDGALAATILALVGVPPQHNAPNRDKYVTVSKENILPDKNQFFNILSDDDWLFNDIDYDFASVSHYDFYKYTANGLSTMKPLKAVDFPVGEASEFSPSDILKIRKLYQHTSEMKGPGMSGDCSKLFRPGTKFDEFEPDEKDNVNKLANVEVNKNDTEKTLAEELVNSARNINKVDVEDGLIGNRIQYVSEIPKQKLKGWKGIIENTMDYDTDRVRESPY